MKTIICPEDFHGPAQTINVAADKDILFSFQNIAQVTFNLQDASPFILVVLLSRPHVLHFTLDYDSEADTVALFDLLTLTNNDNLLDMKELRLQIALWSDSPHACTQACDQFLSAMKSKLQGATATPWSAESGVYVPGLIDMDFKRL